jgi:hypothetical protein
MMGTVPFVHKPFLTRVNIEEPSPLSIDYLTGYLFFALGCVILKVHPFVSNESALRYKQARKN